MKLWDFHTHQIGKPFSIFNEGIEFLPSRGFRSLGIHPWFLNENWSDHLPQISSCAKKDLEVLAIGECGFDRIKGPSIEIQKEAFQAQARLAKKLEIPLILHCVKGHDILLEFLKNEKSPPDIIWHGWNLKPELAQNLVQFSVSFSFGKHLLQEGSNSVKWLKMVPLEKVFLETDDSGLEISQIYEAASLILGMTIESLAQLVKENWNRISSRKIE